MIENRNNQSLAKPQIPIVIGDVHGCFDALDRLLKIIDRSKANNAPLWFVGDILNRGPHSLETLKKIINLGERATLILGNHEMHFLKIASGVGSLQKNDTIESLLSSPNAENFINFLRKKPLCIYNGKFLMVHAGLLPIWELDDILFLSKEISAILSSENWKDFFKPFPKKIDSVLLLKKIQKNNFRNSRNYFSELQAAASIFTRIRYCQENGFPDWKSKQHPKEAPPGNIPWFGVPNRQSKNIRIVFGHWSALGLINKNHLLCVDTGCSWGKTLTAVQLNKIAQERAIWQVPYK